MTDRTSSARRPGPPATIVMVGAPLVALVLVAADAFSTWWLLTHGGPVVREAHPVVRAIVARWGWPVFFAADAARALAVAGGLMLFAVLLRRHPWLRYLLIAAALGVLLYPIAANLWTAWHLTPH